jgi:Putative Actinobacterial Holin-X, holin superfamily III
MAEKQTPSIDRTPPTAYSDWPTLIERAVDDVSRILRSEAHMFQTRMGAALEVQIFNTVTLLTIVGIMISGALCILCAAIFLLHQWLPWWQAFGIAGLVTLFVGIVGKATMKPRSEVAPSGGILNKEFD